MSDVVEKYAAEQYVELQRLGRCPSWWQFAARRRWLHAVAVIASRDCSAYAEMLRDVYTLEDAKRMREHPMPNYACMQVRR